MYIWDVIIFQTRSEWRTIFIMASVFHIAAACLYGVFASGERQTWATIGVKEESKMEEHEIKLIMYLKVMCKNPSHMVQWKLILDNYGRQRFYFTTNIITILYIIIYYITKFKFNNAQRLNRYYSRIWIHNGWGGTYFKLYIVKQCWIVLYLMHQLFKYLYFADLFYTKHNAKIQQFYFLTIR